MKNQETKTMEKNVSKTIGIEIKADVTTFAAWKNYVIGTLIIAFDERYFEDVGA